jgi:hypothetical protein
MVLKWALLLALYVVIGSSLSSHDTLLPSTREGKEVMAAEPEFMACDSSKTQTI